MNKKIFLHDVWVVSKVAMARLRFVMVFVIAALLVGYWENIQNYWDKWTRPAAVEQRVSDIEYTCSMHPDVVREGPGICPICGMPLIERKKGSKEALPEDVLARVQLTPRRIAMAGIETSMVSMRTLVRQVRALGVLDYNETKVAQLSARVGGRADELFIGYTGQSIKQGEAVYSIYSPEVYTAQREYLLARKRVHDLPADASPEARVDASAVYNASMQKLVLWGISREQLDKMDAQYDQSGQVPTHLIVTSPISGIVIRKDIYEGSYVQVGDRPYTIANLETLWLQAKIYERDVPLMRIGQAVNVTVEALPNETFKGQVTFLSFELDPQTRTLDARVEVDNPELRLRPGMFAEAAISVPMTGGEMSAPPAIGPATQSAEAQVYLRGLTPYLAAHDLLANDKAEGVADQLTRLATELSPLGSDPRLENAYHKLDDAAKRSVGQNLADLRKTFRDVSLAMMEIGRTTGVPEGTAAIQVFRCPMTDKPYWLQQGGITSNPYYGSEMPTCGAAVETLPTAANVPIATTQPSTAPAGAVLSIPRSAVINTGRDMMVYVESDPGVFDLRKVTTGPEAQGYFPVLSGLVEGDRVVTRGAFLVDSENRLNPGGR
ncbi:MAG: efflux RND transporter periplasmic adaptor subunit [Phycisphaerales bacterium]|jgi:Cu(I)/Ag(I) efflux system membrane fusion protein|nr:efflux RND transporter periplasmic adaptor subunit [Phycisphaerales bacterium]